LRKILSFPCEPLVVHEDFDPAGFGFLGGFSQANDFHPVLGKILSDESKSLKIPIFCGIGLG